jgi:hypothetical protein
MYYWWHADWYNYWAGLGRRPEGASGSPACRPSPTRAQADQELIRIAADALLNDPAVARGQVDLQVQNGVVILDGDFETAESADAAVARVWTIPGVVDVCNALTVRGSRDRNR